MACGRDDLGTIEQGKRGDVLVLDGDPLDDLAALGSVSAVIQDGVRIR